MVTDLRQALRDTAGDPPAGGLDHAAVIRAGVAVSADAGS